MAGKKKSSKKSRAGKLPKTVAGIKIPKELRKSGEALIATAASPLGREVLMAGVAALVAGAASRMMASPDVSPKTPPDPATPAPPSPPPFDPEAAGARMARRLLDAIGAAVVKANGSQGDPPSRH